jgi:guanylate kinase
MIPKNQTFQPVKPQPLLIVISGPSGVGKDTVVERMEASGLPFHFVITATDRPPRKGEIDGVDYFFVSTEEFERMIAEDELIEYAIVYGEYKGIPKWQVRQAMVTNKDVVMRIDVQGAATIRETYPQALLIFLTTGDEAELIDRLEGRGTESPGDLQRRIEKVRDEMEQVDLFDYVVPNLDGQLDQTVETIAAIIRAEHHRLPHRKVSL